MTVAVVDYGMGNLRSVAKALEHVGAGAVTVTDDPTAIAAAERVVFPGQGAVRDCMAALEAAGLLPVLRDCASDRPFLGVCMGLQALLTESEENEGVRALGIVPGRVRHLQALTGGRPDLKIPHMGWNQVSQARPHPLWRGIEDGAWFYFVHSYYVAPDDERCVVGRCEHGASFAAAIAAGSLFATQFHPEKSQRVGLRLLENFLAWDGGGPR